MKAKKLIIGAVAALAACTVAISAAFADNIGSFVKSTVKKQASPQATPTAWEYETKGYKNSWDYLLARDGFIYGMDYNWCTANEYGGYCLGYNHLLNMAATYSHDIVEMDFYNIKQLGFNTTSWWLLPDGQGITYDDDGLATGIDDEFITNMRDMFELARKTDIAIIPALVPHGTADNNGQGGNGLTPSEIYNKYFRYMWDETALDAFIKNVIDPVNEVIAEYRDVVICVALNIENTTTGVDDFDKGYFEYGNSGTTWDNYSRYLNALHDSVKKYMPETPTSIEMGGGHDWNNADEKIFYQNDLKVDFISENYYHSGGYIEPPSVGYATRPGYIGEYNGGESGFDQASQEYWASIKHSFNKSAKENGWMGAFYYSYSTGGGPFNCMSGMSSDYDSFYYWALSFRYDIADQIKEFRKDTDTSLEKPALLYNRGGDYAYWIPARGATGYKLERSLDGGKTWSTVEANIDPDTQTGSHEQLTNGLIKYKDTGLKKGNKFCYRVTAYNDKGEQAVSNANNSADYFIPENLIGDPGFENGKFITDFETDGYSAWKRVVGQEGSGIISDEKASSGKYSLKMDTVNGESSAYGNVATKVKVKKGTVYHLTFKWLTEKYVTDTSVGIEHMYVRIYNPENGQTISATWLGGETDGEWKAREITANSGACEELAIGISNGSAEVHTISYFDDFSLKELR